MAKMSQSFLCLPKSNEKHFVYPNLGRGSSLLLECQPTILACVSQTQTQGPSQMPPTIYEERM